MSKFKPLATDNSKTGANENSIFYRPQSTIRDQYKNARIEQQEKQQKLLSNVNPINPPRNNRILSKLKPVSRIPIGKIGRNNNKTTSITTNKPITNLQNQLLRNYKREYSRSQYDSFSKSELPSGTLKCSLFKKSLGCNRAYIGHFIGSKGPRFPKSKIHAIREDDLQTQLERIQYDKSLNAKKREELIAKLKFGLEDDTEGRRAHHHGGREWWFHFEENNINKAIIDTDNNNNNNNNNNNKNETDNDSKVHWLGKPKQKDANYSYVLMEWIGSKRTATVYPATFIDFGLSTQLIAEGQASAESAEKRHRQQLEKWRKKQAEKSMMEKLGNLFGHDENGNLREKRKKLRADEMSDESKNKLKEMYIDKKDITNEEMEMLRDMLGDEKYNEFIEEYKEFNKDKRIKLQTSDNCNTSLIEEKILSKRLKANKTRGQSENLGDFDEFMSDDEDETNLNDYDRIDDHEEDVLSDDDGNESEDDASFKKLEKNIDEDITKKEYEVPSIDDKKKGFDPDSDDEEDGDMTWAISEDEDESDLDDDDDDGVRIKNKGKHNKGNNNKNNGDNKNKRNESKKRKLEDKSNGQRPNKRRKLNAVDEKKLNDEITMVITRILKKNPDGIEMIDLWRKVNSVVSTEPGLLKKIVPSALRTIATKKDFDGKKKWVLKEKKGARKK